MITDLRSTNICHCIQHLAYTPKTPVATGEHEAAPYGASLSHDETGNFGITNFWWDKLVRHLLSRRFPTRKKSPTVFNLGYTPEVATRFPKVAELSGGVATGHPSTRIRQQ